MPISDQEIIKRLRESVVKVGTTNKSFALAAGIDASNFSKMLGGAQKITPTSLKKIATAHKINYSWLLNGQGSASAAAVPASNRVTKIRVVERKAKEETRPRLPITAAAGMPGGFADSVTLKECKQMPVIKMLPAYDFTLPISGDSMQPYYIGGDEIAIRKVTSYIEWGKVYVLDTPDGAVVKCLYDDGDKYRCHSYNDQYPDFYIDKETVYGVYKVVGLIRI